MTAYPRFCASESRLRLREVLLGIPEPGECLRLSRVWQVLPGG